MLTKYHRISSYSGTAFRGLSVGRRVDSGRNAVKQRDGFVENACLKRRGLDKSLILQRKEKL